MESSKYRMAVKLVSIFDIILTGLSLFVSFILFIWSFRGENGMAILQDFLLTVFSLNEGHHRAVTVWIVMKFVWFLIGLASMSTVAEKKPGLLGYFLFVIAAIVVNGIPLYFVVKYRKELIVS